MTTKTQVIIGVIVVCTAFAAGRYTTPEKIKIQEKIVEVAKKTTETDRDKHKQTEVTERTLPDGTKETVTKIIEDTATEKKTNSQKTSDGSYSEERTRTKVTVSALAGLPLSPPVSPVYGVSITADVIGPISTGIWALTSGVAGVSLGLSF